MPNRLCKRYAAIFILGFQIMMLGACLGEGRLDENQQEPPTTGEEPAEQDMRAIVSNMTTLEKIGQLMVLGVEGELADEQVKRFIEERHVGGVILFGRNFINIEQSIRLTNALKQFNRNNKVPLFIGVDEEGGRVTRLPEPLLPTPSARELGLAYTSGWAFDIGTLIAEKIAALGLNMDFAPVLDIDSNPLNPVIGDRSFGADPDTVSDVGLELMQGLKSKNVIPVVKHFPGHGDTSTDSHIGLPVIEHDSTRLHSFELLPFQRAIQQDVDAIMVAHLLVQAYDDQYPASMSHSVITKLLRQELGFAGVIVTDDMTMGAIAEHYELGAAAVQSVQAGSDLLLVCHGYEQAAIVLDALEAAIGSGEITESRLDESVYRILALKQKYGLSDQTIEQVDVEELNRKAENLYAEFIGNE